MPSAPWFKSVVAHIIAMHEVPFRIVFFVLESEFAYHLKSRESISISKPTFSFIIWLSSRYTAVTTFSTSKMSGLVEVVFLFIESFSATLTSTLTLPSGTEEYSTCVHAAFSPSWLLWYIVITPASTRFGVVSGSVDHAVLDIS